MSITTPDDRTTTYHPVVATTEFAVRFPLFDNADVSVFVNGEKRTEFTVIASYQRGVSNDARVLLPSGVVGAVTVVGERASRRGNRFNDGGPLPIWQQNLALDALQAESQEQARDLSRALKMNFGTRFGFVQPPEIGASLVWQLDGLLWTIANGPNPWAEVTRLDREIEERKAVDSALHDADEEIRNQISDITPNVAALTARAEAAASSSENAALIADDLVQTAVAGFQGFVDGMAYDFGFITQNMTYFNRDFGGITEPVSN